MSDLMVDVQTQSECYSINIQIFCYVYNDDIHMTEESILMGMVDGYDALDTNIKD